MPLHPTLLDIVCRIALAFIAALAVGFNRGERNEAAGLRTTLLVCLAACFAGVLANLLLTTAGKGPTDFAQIDVLRLPLGILSGIGFIGAGAIIKKDDIALGVTTAATMWFMSVVGLCFGTGFIGLGAAASLLGLTILWALKWFEEKMPTSLRATLVVEGVSQQFDEQALHTIAERSYGLLACPPSPRSLSSLLWGAVIKVTGPAQNCCRGPLKAETGVRFPLGAPMISIGYVGPLAGSATPNKDRTRMENGGNPPRFMICSSGDARGLGAINDQSRYVGKCSAASARTFNRIQEEPRFL